MKNSPDHFYSSIAVRAYAESPKRYVNIPKQVMPDIGPSEWSLIFDTETTTDAAQQLRFGCFQLRNYGELRRTGIFYDPETLNKKELKLILRFTKQHGFELLSLPEFTERVFLYYTYDLSALCIGFNLPFDLSRLALRHSPARGKMKDGFSFELSHSKYRPRIQIKHLSSRSALIQFSKPAEQTTTRSMRKRSVSVPPHRGYFLDVKTLASAILSGSWSLASLAKHLGTKNQKFITEDHGMSLTFEYLNYAMQDVQVTWECFETLEKRYLSFGLENTPITQIYSEASIGKAHLKEMGITPWTESQPDFPPNILGAIMSSYYGGRSEVHIRRRKVRVLYCDFLSMYPTVCTLMGLWRYVIARGVTYEDATAEVERLVVKVRLEDLQRPSFWKKLNVLVKVQPDDDVLPVRAKYSGQNQYSIGLNYLKSDKGQWFTFADCLASKLLTGKPPRIIEAIRFRPKTIQQDLRPIEIMGNSDYRIDPTKEDFYRRLIDLRNQVKDGMRNVSKQRRQELDIEQLTLKICANATSYGIFVELNPITSRIRRKVKCYGAEPFESAIKTIEEPGKYFHPLLSTLITGAARLMLAITEELAKRAEIDWAFCDTDSMALTKPQEMAEIDFVNRTNKIIDWFIPLNPYRVKRPLLKIEEISFHWKKRNLRTPLYCWAISAKRYALFNLAENGKPTIRKASAHGLGHLLTPYENKCPSAIPRPTVPLGEIGVTRWQYDFWYLILEAAINGRASKTEFDKLPNFNRPAVSRYSASTPRLLNWFEKFNLNRAYRDQVKPFNFLLAFQLRLDLHSAKSEKRSAKSGQLAPIAPYDGKSERALRYCFDRNTGEQIQIRKLKTYRELLNQYHLHPEAKFENGDYSDSGATKRRHILVVSVEYIGKEAHRLEEQWFLGADDHAQIRYGLTHDCLAGFRKVLVRGSRRYGLNQLARTSNISPRHISRVLQGNSIPSSQTLVKLVEGVRALDQIAHAEADLMSRVIDEGSRLGLRRLARSAHVDPGNLSHALSGRRRLSLEMRTKLQAVLNQHRKLVSTE